MKYRDELPSPALAVCSGDLFARDVREFRVEVERESEKRLKLWEPVSFTAPSIARPHCCYVATVIFYHHPHLLTRDGKNFQRWEERKTLLKWDAEILFDGSIYRVGGGRVRRRRGGWWMERWAILHRANEKAEVRP